MGKPKRLRSNPKLPGREIKLPNRPCPSNSVTVPGSVLAHYLVYPEAKSSNASTPTVNPSKRVALAWVLTSIENLAFLEEKKKGISRGERTMQKRVRGEEKEEGRGEKEKGGRES